MVDVKNFLAKVEEIAAEEPGYQLGHWGQDHLCDCIGLVIGAIRRAGGSWRGTHGSNYAARNETDKIIKITGAAGELTIGETVYKAREPGDAKYNLPGKYRPGGASYTGDVLDYYHVGVVVSTDPLRIRHMTTPQPKMDTKIGNWAYHGRLKKILYDGGGTKVNEQATVELPAGSKGSTVNLRATPSASGKVIARVPVGAVVDVIEDKATWCNVTVQGYTGWMMSNYLVYAGGGEEVSGDVITAEEREQIDNYLADIEGRVEKIREILGRG